MKNILNLAGETAITIVALAVCAVLHVVASAGTVYVVMKVGNETLKCMMMSMMGGSC